MSSKGGHNTPSELHGEAMRPKRKNVALIFISALLFLFTYAASALAYNFPGWEHGAEGHRKVFTHAKQTKEPVIIYFNADWCGYCKELNSDYLETAAVSKFLTPFTKVEIKPDLGDEEKKLQDQYGAAGFPSFLLIIPLQGSRVKSYKIHPFGGGANMTTAQFIQRMEAIISKHFNSQAQSFASQGDKNTAAKYYEMTLKFVPDNLQANFKLARAYHDLGNQTRDLNILRKAKNHYQKVLSVNPNHQESKRRLHSLKNL